MMMFQTLSRVMTSPADTLKVECQVCRHRALWSRVRAFRAFGPDATPVDVRRRRLRCTDCNAVARVNVWI